MIINFKTLQQQSFVIQAEEQQTVAQLKNKIEIQETFPIAHQKLILKGKILADDVVVGSLGVTEKDFIVVMVTKVDFLFANIQPKIASTPVVHSSTAASSATTQVAPPSTTISPSTAVAPNPDSAISPTPAEPATNTTNTAFTESTLATGSAYELAVNNLVEMGFPKDQVVAAMRAAFNNPDRAADYLMNGIPESAREPLAAAATTPATTLATTPATTPATSTAPAPAVGQYVNLFQQAAQLAQSGGATQAAPATGTAPAGATSTDLEFLRNSPQFQNLRQMVQAQPHLLPALLQQIGQTNPQLLQLISQNQDQFLGMLAEGGGGATLGEGDLGAGAEQYVTITDSENEAVARLASLGFDRTQALEAYLACDKNEELAANFLFDGLGGDM